MKIRILMILLLLCSQTQALNVVMYDQTEGYEDTIQIYENDNNSDNHIKSVNIEGNATLVEPFTLGDNLGYIIQLEPLYHSVLRNPNDENFVSYWFDYMRYWMLGFFIILIIGGLLWKTYWRRN